MSLFGEYVQLFLSKYFEGEGLLIKNRRGQDLPVSVSFLKILVAEAAQLRALLLDTEVQS
jgi:hypothetical protein